MKKIILAVFVILALIFLLYRQTPSVSSISVNNPQVILFVSENCSHCQNVKDYIRQNQVETKVKIDYKEIYQNPKNEQLLIDTAKKCPNIDTSAGVGVPLALFTADQTCLNGDTPIIDRLSQMIK